MFHPGGRESSDYRVFLKEFWETGKFFTILLSSAYSMLGLIVIRLVAIIKKKPVSSHSIIMLLYNINCMAVRNIECGEKQQPGTREMAKR